MPARVSSARLLGASSLSSGRGRARMRDVDILRAATDDVSASSAAGPAANTVARAGLPRGCGASRLCRSACSATSRSAQRCSAASTRARASSAIPTLSVGIARTLRVLERFDNLARNPTFCTVARVGFHAPHSLDAPILARKPRTANEPAHGVTLLLAMKQQRQQRGQRPGHQETRQWPPPPLSPPPATR